MSGILSNDPIDLVPALFVAEWGTYGSSDWSLAFKPPLARFIEFGDALGYSVLPYRIIKAPFQLNGEEKTLIAFACPASRPELWGWSSLSGYQPLRYRAKVPFLIRSNSYPGTTVKHGYFEDALKLDIWRGSAGERFFEMLQQVMSL